MTNQKQIFSNKVAPSILIFLYCNSRRNLNLTAVKNGVGITSNSMVLSSKLLEKQGLLTREKINGRSLRITITEKGKLIAKELLEIQEILK